MSGLVVAVVGGGGVWGQNMAEADEGMEMVGSVFRVWISVGCAVVYPWLFMGVWTVWYMGSGVWLVESGDACGGHTRPDFPPIQRGIM